MHQQVPHRDVFALVQCVGPFTRLPTETGKDVGAHTGLIILLKKGIYVEAPERVRHLRPWIGRLKDRHIQSRWCQPFPFPTPSAPTPAACSLAVEYPSESGASLSGEEGGEPPLLTVVQWVFGGLPRSHAVPAQATSLASVLSPDPEVLPSC